MSIHHMKKARYQKLKESGLTAEELKAQLLVDQISEEDINALITELYSGEASNSLPNAPTPPEGDAAIDIQPIVHIVETKTALRFDYKNLNGEAWKKYEDYVKQLPLYDLQDFSVYKVRAVISELYPGLPDSPRAMTGIEIVNDKPIHNTRVDVKTALEMNAQVRNSGRYYLLRQ